MPTLWNHCHFWDVSIVIAAEPSSGNLVHVGRRVFLLAYYTTSLKSIKLAEALFWQQLYVQTEGFAGRLAVVRSCEHFTFLADDVALAKLWYLGQT